MSYECIRSQSDGGVVTITLNRPGVMNALSSQMRRELCEALDVALEAPTDTRVIVLTGEGRAFCSGQDLADAQDIAAVDFETILNEEYVPLLRRITDAPVPVIAAVNGAAAGAGANIALACDVVTADGRHTEAELRMLEEIRHELTIDRLHAAAIEWGTRVRHLQP